MTTTGTTATLDRSDDLAVSHSYVASRAGRHLDLDAVSVKAATKAARRRLGHDFELFRETPIGFERVLP